MNKRRRFKAKRRAKVAELTDMFHRPWAHGYVREQLFVGRRLAKARLRSMGIEIW